MRFGSRALYGCSSRNRPRDTARGSVLIKSGKVASSAARSDDGHPPKHGRSAPETYAGEVGVSFAQWKEVSETLSHWCDRDPHA
jgi:hypothetical protein